MRKIKVQGKKKTKAKILRKKISTIRRHINKTLLKNISGMCRLLRWGKAGVGVGERRTQ